MDRVHSDIKMKTSKDEECFREAKRLHAYLQEKHQLGLIRACSHNGALDEAYRELELLPWRYTLDLDVSTVLWEKLINPGIKQLKI